MQRFNWNLSAVDPKDMYALRTDDAQGLLLDSVSMGDIMSDPSNEHGVCFDALVMQSGKMEQKAAIFARIMGGKTDLSVVSTQISDPFKKNGTVNRAIVFELSDGQTISIYLHNPNSSTKTMRPDDDLVSWRLLLNKRDVSIVVAPEKGKDVPVREVCTRLMKLAAKNSEAFVRANTKRANTMAAIETLKKSISEKEATLLELTHDIERAQADKSDKKPRESSIADAPIALTGKELGDFDTNTDDGKKAMRAALGEHLAGMRGEVVDCPILGGKVVIEGSDTENALALTANPLKMKAIYAIKELIKTAKSKQKQGDDKPKTEQGAVECYRLKNDMSIDGVDVAVEMIVEQWSDGLYHYDMVISKEKATFDSSKVASTDAETLNSYSILSTSDGIKPQNDYGVNVAMDASSEDDDDFDEQEEFDLIQDGDEDDDPVVYDGDFKGHPFRGNQYKSASRASGAAVHASKSAKRAEINGDKKALKSAHRAAYHAHAAASESASGKAKKYHNKMARFHGKHGGIAMDDIYSDDVDFDSVSQMVLNLSVKIKDADGNWVDVPDAAANPDEPLPNAGGEDLELVGVDRLEVNAYAKPYKNAIFKEWKHPTTGESRVYISGCYPFTKNGVKCWVEKLSTPDAFGYDYDIKTKLEPSAGLKNDAVVSEAEAAMTEKIGKRPKLFSEVLYLAGVSDIQVTTENVSKSVAAANPDRDFLQGIIDGKMNSEMANPAFADKLTEMYERTKDKEMSELFNKAVDVYSSFAVEQAGKLS